MTYSVLAIHVLIVGLFYVLNGEECGQNDVRVRTESGALCGFRTNSATEKSVDVFYGIPYAIPPLGSRRFQPPTAVTWRGIRNAKKKPKSCPQEVPEYLGSKPPRWLIPPVEETSEDCLYLNVFAPYPKPVKAPVMVWIHGGGFAFGYGSSDKYDGRLLASEERVIVVTFNYRLSVLGFLYLGLQEVPGNMGLMDQALAIRWVKQNIRSFGGDPEQITLFGESAGSASVGYHLLIPSSRDLFRRVIMESGTPTNPWASTDAADGLAMSLDIAAKCGCIPYRDIRPFETIYCLQRTPVSVLMAAVSSLPKKRPSVSLTPVVDGVYIPVELTKSFSKNVDVLIGTNTGDGVLPILTERLLPVSDNATVSGHGFVEFIYKLTNTNRDLRGNLVVDVVRFFYTDWTNPNDSFSLRERVVDLADDYFFNCGTNLLVSLLNANGNRVYRYWFDVRPSTRRLPAWIRSYHGVEMDFVFGSPLDKTKGFTDDEVTLSKNLMRFWANFAKNGIPDDQWAANTLSGKEYLEIKLNSLDTKSGIRAHACALWNCIIPRIVRVDRDN